jgi:hypothetical protein
LIIDETKLLDIISFRLEIREKLHPLRNNIASPPKVDDISPVRKRGARSTRVGPATPIPEMRTDLFCISFKEPRFSASVRRDSSEGW